MSNSYITEKNAPKEDRLCLEIWPLFKRDLQTKRMKICFTNMLDVLRCLAVNINDFNAKT